MEIITLGEDTRLSYSLEYASDKLSHLTGRMYILPIPSFRDGEHISGSEIGIEELASRLSESDIVAGYALPDALCSVIWERGIRTVDISSDGEYTLRGAYLTALGTLEYVLSSLPSDPSEAHIGIIGYGRIGRYLMDIFSYFGASLTLFTSKGGEVFLGMPERVYSYRRMCNETLAPLDILINTAPAKIIDDTMREVLSGKTVIELASGDNIPPAVPSVRLMSLPARSFPRSAGIAYGEAIVRGALGVMNLKK